MNFRVITKDVDTRLGHYDDIMVTLWTLYTVYTKDALSHSGTLQKKIQINIKKDGKLGSKVTSAFLFDPF